MSGWHEEASAKVYSTSWDVSPESALKCPEIVYSVSGEECYPQTCRNSSDTSYLIKEASGTNIELRVKDVFKVKKWNSDGTYEFSDLESYLQYRVIVTKDGKKKCYKLVEATEEELDEELRDINKEYYDFCDDLNQKEARIDQQIYGLMGLGYIPVYGTPLEKTILIKDGAFYSLDLKVLENPSLEGYSVSPEQITAMLENSKNEGSAAKNGSEKESSFAGRCFDEDPDDLPF
ncbi:MAG: hypothetical protein MJ239_04825 [Bacilli bacterium]|nr:hypothetical protein [Bacilli bacterium]